MSVNRPEIDQLAGEFGHSKIDQLSPDSLALIAEFFKALSEPNRLHIVCTLKSGPCSVTEIVNQTGLGQANVSKHLKILSQSGIVRRKQRGVSVYYEVANPAFFELCAIVCETLSIRLNQQSQQTKEIAAIASKTITSHL